MSGLDGGNGCLPWGPEGVRADPDPPPAERLVQSLADSPCRVTLDEASRRQQQHLTPRWSLRLPSTTRCLLPGRGRDVHSDCIIVRWVRVGIHQVNPDLEVVAQYDVVPGEFAGLS